MSRSYKHTPIVKDHDSGKLGKKAANRRVRQCKDAIPNGKGYRRLFNPYDIHDTVSRYSWSEFVADKEADAKLIENGVQKNRYRMDEHDWAKWFKWK